MAADQGLLFLIKLGKIFCTKAMGHMEFQEEMTQQSGMYGNLVKIQALRVGVGGGGL